jgi:hypothetical protein
MVKEIVGREPPTDASPRAAVQNLLTDGAYPVDGPRAKIFFVTGAARNGMAAHCARPFVSRFACKRPSDP